MSDIRFAMVMGLVYRTVVMGFGLALALMGYSLLRRKPTQRRRKKGTEAPHGEGDTLSDIIVEKGRVIAHNTPQGTLLVVAGCVVVGIAIWPPQDYSRKVVTTTTQPGPMAPGRAMPSPAGDATASEKMACTKAAQGDPKKP